MTSSNGSTLLPRPRDARGPGAARSATQTKTDYVRNRIFRAILRGDYGPGDKIPTEREMERLTRTSRVTVRRAYADLERSGVMERRQGRGTYIATAVRGHAQAAREIALLASVRDPFALEFIQALETSLNVQDALLILKITEQDPRKEEEAAIDLVGKGIRNLVIWPSGGGFPTDTFRRLRIVGTNMVFFDRMLPGPYADFVGLDNRQAVVALLKEALRNGRERFLFISHKGLEADSDRQREEAFRLYCERQGLPHRMVRVPWRGDILGAIRRHRRAWFVEAKNQAVICVNDAVALHVKSAGGGKIDVYGIDGLPEARAAGIPTCEQPMKAMARKAIELLWAQQQQSTKWKARQVYCRGRLIRRKT